MLPTVNLQTSYRADAGTARASPCSGTGLAVQGYKHYTVQDLRNRGPGDSLIATLVSETRRQDRCGAVAARGPGSLWPEQARQRDATVEVAQRFEAADISKRSTISDLPTSSSFGCRRSPYLEAGCLLPYPTGPAPVQGPPVGRERDLAVLEEARKALAG